MRTPPSFVRARWLLVLCTGLAMTSSAAVAQAWPMFGLDITNTASSYDGKISAANFLHAGVPILAQRNAKEVIARHAKKGPDMALPSVTFDKEQTIDPADVTVEVLHLGAARTSGDAVAYFPGLKTVAAGDLYTTGKSTIDACAGGSRRGGRTSLRQPLKARLRHRGAGERASG